MPSFRTASFWIAALVLPGGFLLLAPKAWHLAQKIRTKKHSLPDHH
jgi:hypothetical protein